MKIQIVTTKCDRCGKPLATTNRSIHGLDSLKAECGNICSTCATESEKFEILQQQGQALAGKYRRV